MHKICADHNGSMLLPTYYAPNYAGVIATCLSAATNTILMFGNMNVQVLWVSQKSSINQIV